MALAGYPHKAKINDLAAKRNGFSRKKATELVEILLELIKQSL
jgi:hypothetical protein